MRQLIFLVAVLIIAGRSDGQTVDGYYRERYWMNFDMNLWTYCIHPNHSIFNENTTISEEKTEWTKGLTFMENKKISYLPIKVYKNFPNLIAYNAYNCSLKTIHTGGFDRLKELQFIGLSHNFLSSICQTAFRNIPKLRYLYLSNNHLKAIDENLFNKVGNLRALLISHNEISLVPKNAFSSLVELRNISLSFNKIKMMENDHFENNTNLERIWLNNNEIEFLNSKMFDNMSNLKTVNLEENRCINASANALRLQQLKEMIKRNC